MAERKRFHPGTPADLRGRSTRAKTELSAAGVVPRRSRGQNFLTQGAIADRIVAAAELGPDDDVLEIGPGLGILTERIAARELRSLTVVELDRTLAERLAANFRDDRRVRIVAADFVRIDFASLAGGTVKVLGNLPFNAAAAIFRRLCDFHDRVALMVLMFQREVGERMRAAAGEPAYSALSVFSALYFDIDLHFRVLAGSFHPKPRVDAEVIRFRPRPALFRSEEEAAVIEVVHASFSARRKMLRNSLAGGLGVGSAQAAEYLVRAGIDPAARAESLSPADFVRLARAIPR